MFKDYVYPNASMLQTIKGVSFKRKVLKEQDCLVLSTELIM